MRRLWFGRPVPAVSVTSGLRQLPDDSREIDPHVLAPDIAGVGEFDDMKHAELERTVAAFQTERPARRPAPPQRLVYYEIIAVEPPDAVDLAFGQVSEQGLVEGACAGAATGRAGRPADDVVLTSGDSVARTPSTSSLASKLKCSSIFRSISLRVSAMIRSSAHEVWIRCVDHNEI